VARVPVSRGPTVERQALRPVYQGGIDASSGLQQVARGLDQAANVMDASMRRDAEIEVNRIDNEITSGWLQWDADNRRQYQGQNIGEYEAKAKEWWDKARETYGATTSPLVQQALGQQLARKRNQAMGSVLGHVNTTKERFADEQYGAAVSNETELAADIGTPEASAASRARVAKLVAEYGQRKGFDTDQVIEEQQRQLGGLHLVIATSLAEGNGKAPANPAAARAYYEQNKHEIPKQAQRGLEAAITSEEDNRFAASFALKHADNPLGEALAALSDVSDPQKQQKARLAVMNQHAAVRAAAEQRQNAAREEVYQLYEQGKPVPERLLGTMGGPERSQFTAMSMARAKQAAAGKTDVKTDLATYFEAVDAISTGKPFNLLAYQHKISTSDLRSLKAAQLKANAPGAEKEQKRMFTEEQIIASYRPEDMKSTSEEWLTMRRRLNDALIQSRDLKGKEMTDVEVRNLIDDMMVEGVIEKSWWFDSKKRRADMTPEELAKAKLPGDRAVRITSDAEYIALPSGTSFIDPKGQPRVKP
jgi:hypothetical protein